MRMTIVMSPAADCLHPAGMSMRTNTDIAFGSRVVRSLCAIHQAWSQVLIPVTRRSVSGAAPGPASVMGFVRDELANTAYESTRSNHRHYCAWLQ